MDTVSAQTCVQLSTLADKMVQARRHESGYYLHLSTLAFGQHLLCTFLLIATIDIIHSLKAFRSGNDSRGLCAKDTARTKDKHKQLYKTRTSLEFASK